jgi:hypothetical protein
VVAAGNQGRWWRIGARAGRARIWTMVLGLVIGALAWSTSARAGNDKRADKLIQRGVELRKAGKDEQALEVFRSAYAIEASPRVQGQIALAEQALGRWVEAESDMVSALEGPQDPWIEKNRAALRAALTVVRQHLASLDVVGSPAGARVKVDDRDIGVLPFDKPVRVTAGEIVVSVSAPGHTEISRKIKTGPGDLVREVFTLHSVEEAPAPAAKPAMESAPVPPRIAGGGSDGVAAAPPESSLPHADEGGRTSAVRYSGFAVGASGLVAAGVGTYFALHAISKNNESKSGCPGATCDSAPSRQARQDALTAGDRATWAFAVGGVLIAAGATLVVLGRRHAGSQDVALQVTPSGGPGQIGLLGTLGF